MTTLDNRRLMNNNAKIGAGNAKKGYDAAWMDAAKAIADRGLRGLRVRCPKCHRAGTLISKWVKGPSIKPLYIVHVNGNGHFKACPVKGEQAANARSRVTITSEDVGKTLRMGRLFILFSGGKDSLCLLEYIKKLCARTKKDFTALHVDTTAGLPEVEEYVQEVCKKLGVRLVTLRPSHDYFDLAKRWGIPGVKSRWCCQTLKIAPIRRFLAEVEGPKLVYDGIRAAESYIRAKYTPVWFHPSFRCISVSPIFAWSDKKVENYIERHNLPQSPVSHLGCSAECWCGAYKKRGDFEKLLEVRPEIFDKLVEVEKAQRGRFTFIYENGRQVPLLSLKRVRGRPGAEALERRD